MALNLPKSTPLLAVVLIFIFKSGLYGANDKTFKGRLEIIANGKLVAWENLKSTDQDKIYSQTLEAEINLSESTWIIGRVTSVGGSKMLPRNLTVFAHSNPVYFLLDGKSTYVPESQKYLRLYQKAAVNWVEKYSNFRNGAERERALQYLQQAKEAISKKF